jgi:hypothetical protein
MDRCSLCDSITEYSSEYDAYYCPYCNQWIEDKCDSPICELCRDRPDRPIEIGEIIAYNSDIDDIVIIEYDDVGLYICRGGMDMGMVFHMPGDIDRILNSDSLVVLEHNRR